MLTEPRTGNLPRRTVRLRRPYVIVATSTVVAAAVIACATLVWSGPPRSVVYVITPTLVLVAYLVVGFVAWRIHPGERIGLLFTATGCAWFLHRLIYLHSPFPFTISLLTWTFYQVSLAHLGLAWPHGWLRSRVDMVVVAVIYCANIGGKAVEMLFWDPRADGCGSACPSNVILVHGSDRLVDDIRHVNSIVGTCIAVAVVVLIGAHWRSARGYARRAMTALICVALPVAAYIVLYDLKEAAYLGVPDLALAGFAPLVLITAPAAYAISLFRAWSARAAVRTALVDLEPGPAPARLRDALARAMGDPALQLAFRVPGSGGYVDTSGVPVEVDLPPAGRMATPLGSGSGAVLVHDDELRHEPELVRVAAAAANLALEHSRLQAEIQAQLEQVRASRARIVEAGDTARRRLERDLHDGAQQRLVTLSLALGMARSQAAGIDPGLESLLELAGKEAKEALAELRDLARGIHPAVLTEAGLTAAIQALVERSPAAATVTTVPAGRFAAPVEAAAYFVVSEALANVAKHAPGVMARIGIWQRDGQLLVEVSDNGPGGARTDAGSGLRGLGDRVAALNGVVHIDSAPGRGTRLTAQVPCQ